MGFAKSGGYAPFSGDASKATDRIHFGQPKPPPLADVTYDAHLAGGKSRRRSGRQEGAFL